MNSEQLKETLQQFIGTEYYHRLGLYKTLATDGMFYFCETAEAFWLFDEIANFVTYKTKEPFVTVIAESEKPSWKQDCNGTRFPSICKEAPTRF